MGRRVATLLAVVAALLAQRADAALSFNFTSGDGSLADGDDMWEGFEAAATLWSSALNDNVTVEIDIRTASLGGSTLGSASSTRNTFSYAAFRTALTNDASSADDATVTSNLPSGSGFDLYVNKLTDNGGAAFVDSDGDANNTTIRLTRANAKALGLVSGASTTLDGEITFSSDFSWDFDRSDGIAGGTFDFTAVAVHEIGHVLGFVSGVDVLDANADAFPDSAFTWVSPVDLMRYSQTSADLGVIDWTAGAETKHWSLDGGQNSVSGVTFSTGRNFGDGEQNSHWKDNQGLGLLDPTLAPGVQNDLTETDIRLYDTIGWDLASALSAVSTTPLASGAGGGAAPEPVLLGHLGVLVVALYATGRRRGRRGATP